MLLEQLEIVEYQQLVHPYLKFYFFFALSISYPFEALTSLSIHMMTDTFAFLHSFMIRHGKGKALAVLCARTDILSAIIYAKSIFNPSIKLATKTTLYGLRFSSLPISINLSQTTTYQNLSLKLNEDLVILSQFSTKMAYHYQSILMLAMIVGWVIWSSYDQALR